MSRRNYRHLAWEEQPLLRPVRRPRLNMLFPIMLAFMVGVLLGTLF